MKRNSKWMMKTLAAGVALGLAGQAHAAITDFVYFRAAPIVMVWGANAAGTTPIVSDFVLVNTASFTAGVDLIGGANVRPVVTGSMTAIPTTMPTGDSLFSVTGVATPTFSDAGTAGALDALDTFTAWALDATSDISFTATQNHSFYVASNSPFRIHAVTGAATGTGDLASLAMTAISWSMAENVNGTDGGVTYGMNAQTTVPTFSAGTDLSTFAGAGAEAVNATVRTAASAGTILGHSVRFTATYGLNYDLSMGAGTLEVPVTYTIYSP